jgi:hypothetical protein
MFSRALTRRLVRQVPGAPLGAGTSTTTLDRRAIVAIVEKSFIQGK